MSRRRFFTILILSIFTLGTLTYTSSQASLGTSLLSQPYAPGQNEVCYAIADNDDSLDEDTLVRAAYETGEVTLIGNTGTINIEAMTFQVSTGTLFAADGRQLGTLDTTTAAFTPRAERFGTGDGALGPIGLSDADGMSFHPVTGELYLSHRIRGQNDLLFKANPVTGAHIENAFGPGVDYLVVDGTTLEFQDIDDLAFDVTTGVLYAIANSFGAGDHLTTVDLTTGLLSIVGPINVDDMEGLTFDTTGQLLGTTGKQSRENSNKLWRIDKTTGNGDIPNAKSLTLQDNPPSPFDYEAVDCLASSVSITPTPTPTETQTAPTPTQTPTITVTPPPDFVDLLYFEVESVDGTQVTLSWATGAEVGTYGFNIYRSGDDRFANATLIGFEPARGGRETTSYEFVDTIPSEGMYWYFLEEVSTEGGKGSSGVIGTTATFRRVFVPFLVVRSRP